MKGVSVSCDSQTVLISVSAVLLIILKSACIGFTDSVTYIDCVNPQAQLTIEP